MTKYRSALFLGSALIGLASFGFAGAAAAADQTYQFDIPAESLGQALTDFSQVSSQNIIMSEDVAKGRLSKGLHGRYTAEQALNVLLAGTDLRVETNAAGVLMVRSKNAQAASNEGAGTEQSGTIETVTVTGTHLRNVEPLSPVTTITAGQLYSQGYSTLSEALAQLPQNSGAGASAGSNANSGIGENGYFNYSFGNGVNLRGLGPGDTLVLLNGQRLPSTAYGETIDISGIPVSAIDHVDILPDGASAIYGSDAVAGVVNIVTKTDYSGVETGFGMNNIANGKAPDWNGHVLGGFDWGSGNALLSYDFEKQEPMPASARSYASAGGYQLLPRDETSSLYGTVDQSLGANLKLTGFGMYSTRTFSDTVEYLGLPDLQATGRSNQLAASAQLTYSAFSDWVFSLDGSIGLENDTDNVDYPQSGFDAPGPLRYGVYTGELQGDGTILSLPGGDVRLAIGASDRAETFSYAQYACTPSCSVAAGTKGADNDFSAYAELLIPIVGAANHVPFIEQLRIDAAVRYDDYSRFGDTTNPKVTVQWVPVSDLTLHGSFATSFKAPTLYQTSTISVEPPYSILQHENPSDLSSPDAIILGDNTNPLLKPETAQTYSAGASYEPSFVSGLKLDASYFDINYHGKVENLYDYFASGDLSAQAAQLGSYLTANPTLTQVNAALANPLVYNWLGGPGVAAPYSPSDFKAIANLGLVNAAVVNVQGLDFDFSYGFDTAIGHIGTDMAGTYYINDQQQVTPTSVPTADGGIVGQPPRFRGRLNVNWMSGPWNANARVNYVGSETNQFDTSCSAAGCPVSSWTTVDASISYAFDKSNIEFLSGTKLRLSVFNIFDRAPPYVGDIGLGFDPVNANPLGRAFSLSLTKSW